MQLALFCFNLGGWVGGLVRRRGAGWRRGGQGRDDGLELVWRHRGDGYSIERPEPLQTAFQGTFRFQVEPNWAHLDLFES